VSEKSKLLELMRAAPDDDGPKLVYADWLLARGDVRGELIVLDQRDRAGLLAGIDELERLLWLAAEHGFPRLPDDPCARILPFQGGGSFPVQYDVDHEGRHYYLRWRYGFSIDVDYETVLETDLDTLTTNQWTFRETTVILAIISGAIRRGAPLSALVFPSGDALPRHPRYHLGRAPAYVLPDEVRASAPGSDRWTLQVRDFARWYALWDWRQRLRGIAQPSFTRSSCACGVDGLSCGVAACEAL
jgi:uncharacterized protein (TIGR02996 family)